LFDWFEVVYNGLGANRPAAPLGGGPNQPG